MHKFLVLKLYDTLSKSQKLSEDTIFLYSLFNKISLSDYGNIEPKSNNRVYNTWTIKSFLQFPSFL